MNRCRFILLLLLVAFLAACGKKGPPRPLLQKLPAAPGHLALQQQGQRLVLSWKLPESNQDGSPLTDLQGFKVLKMEYEPDRDCPECRDTSVLFATVDLDYLRDVRRQGDRLSLWDGAVEPGTGYQYRVVPVNAAGAAGAGAVVKGVFVLPPAPPGRPEASGHDRLVRLHWSPPARTRPGVEVLGYNVYRRQGEAPFPLTPINRSPLAETRMEDFGLENGVAYEYAVRTLAVVSGRRAESPLSPVVPVVPRAGQ